jgi:hypothetical protein
MSAFPAVLAGNWPVLTLVMVAVPSAPMVWQLTMATSSCLWNIWPPVNPSALILAMAREQDKT